MQDKEPATALDARFSGPDATARPWADAWGELDRAELYWLATVRPDGRPHVTPLIAVLVDDAMYFCTGADERKGKNLAQNHSCILVTGCNNLNEGLDVVVEGDAVPVEDDPTLHRIAAAYVSKYGPGWRFTVGDGAFHHEGGTAVVFRVAPSVVFGFGKGEPFTQSRYRF